MNKYTADGPCEVPDSWPPDLNSHPLHLHFSGYDPRAAGGRQTIKLELCGVVTEAITQIDVQLRSDLIEPGQSQHRFIRAASGQWRSLLIEFSSKNKEHGQYSMEVALHHAVTDTKRRRWTCTAVLFVPRPDATLTEIHRVFLGSQKNIKILADDGAIAKISGLGDHAQNNIEISATNAAIAQLDMSAPKGKYNVGFGTIAWDEELIEESIDESIEEGIDAAIASRETLAGSLSRSQPKHCATLVSATPQAHRQIRLFALGQWVLGRFESHYPSADILLAHNGTSKAESAGLTRRISAQHAIIRRTSAGTGTGVEIIDVSRYGILLDGLPVDKDTPTPLRVGTRIELCASFKGIACLQVIAIQAHAVILKSIDATGDEEFFYLLQPEMQTDSLATGLPHGLPQLFHHQGSFWHLDGGTRREILRSADTVPDALPKLHGQCWTIREPYADLKVSGYGAWHDTQMG